MFLVGVGGAAGAVVRWLISTFDASSVFPWPTLLVNIVGAGILGWVLVSTPTPTYRALLGTGFCGGLTTFSTLSVEVASLLRDNDNTPAILYLLTSVVLGVVAYLAGRALGTKGLGTG